MRPSPAEQKVVCGGMGQPMGQSKGDFLLSPGFHPKTSETLSLPHPPHIWAEAAETEVDSWFKLICVTSFHSQPTGNQHHVPGSCGVAGRCCALIVQGFISNNSTCATPRWLHCCRTAAGKSVGWVPGAGVGRQCWGVCIKPYGSSLMAL